jgi:hypothetical protein
MVTDARFLRHRFDEVFEIDHGRKQSLKERYGLFHVHDPTPSQGGAEEGPIQVAKTPEGTKLVSIVFSTRLGGDGQDVEQRLQEIRSLLNELLEPGEQCRLFVERESHDDEDVFVREARGYIAQPDSSEAL